VAVMMLIGMAGMFLAPFGMLISKWAVLKAVVDASPALSVFIVFGSSATLFFWVKWMGKLVEVVEPQPRLAREISAGESVALYGLSVATFLSCLLFPLMSTQYVEPYVRGLYGHVGTLGFGNNVVLAVLMGLVMLFPLSFLSRGRGVKLVDPYLGGANTQNSIRFLGSGGAVENLGMHNYYLSSVFDETWLARCGVVCGAVLLVVMMGLTCL
jgi:ech hydrogenase subunit A